jgi:predicted site-specific integrase-resolvase
VVDDCEWMSVRLVAELMGVTEKTVLRWLREGKLAGDKGDRSENDLPKWRITYDSYREWKAVVDAFRKKGDEDAVQDHG